MSNAFSKRTRDDRVCLSQRKLRLFARVTSALIAHLFLLTVIGI